MYAVIVKPGLKFRFGAADQLFFLEKDSGIFRAMNLDTKMLTLDSRCIVTCEQNENGETIVNVHTRGNPRFSVAFAFFSKQAYRLRSRVLMTSDAGPIIFPLFKTFPNEAGVYTFPNHMENTVLILGIRSLSNESKVMVKAFLHDERTLFGKFIYHRYDDEITISDSMKMQADRNLVSSILFIVFPSISHCSFPKFQNTMTQAVSTPPAVS